MHTAINFSTPVTINKTALHRRVWMNLTNDTERKLFLLRTKTGKIKLLMGEE